MNVPLCIRVEIYNYTNPCQRIVTSSGILKLDENHLNENMNLSICIDQYENFCGETVQVELSKEIFFWFLFFLQITQKKFNCRTRNIV